MRKVTLKPIRIELPASKEFAQLTRVSGQLESDLRENFQRLQAWANGEDSVYSFIPELTGAIFGDDIVAGKMADPVNPDRIIETRVPLGGIIEYLTGIPMRVRGQAGQGYLHSITEDASEAAFTTITDNASIVRNAGVVLLCYGRWDADEPIGTPTSIDPETVIGQLYKCVSAIQYYNPAARVIIVSPWNWMTDGATLNATIKEFCANYSIAYVDMTNGPINSLNGDMMELGGYPTNEAYLAIGRFLAAQIESLIR